MSGAGGDGAVRVAGDDALSASSVEHARTETPPTLDYVELTALLAEIRGLVTTDTAVLLLVDRSHKVLVPVASVGIDRAGRTGMRIRVGEGFAGTIAASGDPMIVDAVGPENVVNPQLLDRGLRSLLGVPVRLHGRMIGVLHVGTLTPRAFTSRDVQLLLGAAERLATAVHDRRSAEEHTAALVLQRSLLPTVLPDVDGLDMAARYIPADGDFGGDWYDVFPLPGGRIGFVMGDVIGHGLHAAVVMGRLRSALRAYALEHEDPAEVLRHLDRKITHFERDAFSTVFYAVSSAPYDRLVVSSAGHLSPLLAAPGRPAQHLTIAVDAPLAVKPDQQRRSSVIDLPVGASMCLFTDGLVERRPTQDGEDQLSHGIDRVLAALDLESTGDVSAEQTCTSLIDAALLDDPEDDVALLVIRRTA